jgi:hypothetical protein
VKALNVVQALLLCACAAGGPAGSDGAASLDAYLAGASHLTAAQRESMRRHRPFEGMTLEEAGLAMQPVETEIVMGERVRQAVYAGGGTYYRLVFEGTPERVVEWVVAEDVTLPAPETYQPQPPIPRPGR